MNAYSLICWFSKKYEKKKKKEKKEKRKSVGCSSKFHSEENMRAYQLPKGGAGIDALVKVERSDPKPAYRQVVVKVKACSLNFRDLGIVRGIYRMPVRENLIPLSDGAGEVIEVGPGVTRVKVGDTVAGCFFQRWVGGEAPADVHTSALGGGIDGMLAEYAVLEEDGVVKNSSALVAGGGRDPPLCWRHRLERDDGARQVDRRSDGFVAGDRWRLDLRPPVRAHDGHSGDHHVVER